MSLIVTSSSQDQYGSEQRANRLRHGAGLENPSSFQNYFTSPIKIPKNAEIAVESIKIRRDALYDIEQNTMMYSYFGKLQTKGSESDEDSKSGGKKSRVDMPIPMRPAPGTYSLSDWVVELNRIFNNSYGSPEIFGQHVITEVADALGETAQLQIKTTQRGKGHANQVNPGEMLSGYWKSPNNLSTSYKPDLDWECEHVVAVGGVDKHQLFTRLQDGVGATDLEILDERSCSVQGHGHPFALVGSKMVVDVSGAKGAGWRVGLARPQMEYLRTNASNVSASKQRANLLPGTRHPEGGIEDGVVSSNYNFFNTYNGRDQKDFYDYMVQDDGVNIEIYQLSYSNVHQNNQLVMSEVIYYAANKKLTKAQFNALYTSVQFRGRGDEICVDFLDAAGNPTVIVDSTESAQRDKCFLPIGSTRSSLYPRLNLSEADNTLKIFEYDSHYSALQYRFPTYDDATETFTTGDDFYTNNRVNRYSAGQTGADTNTVVVKDTYDRPYCLSQTLICDTKPQYEVDETGASTALSVFLGELASGDGVDKDHAYIIGYNKPLGKHDYLEGKYLTSDTSGQAKINSIIGFPEKGFIDQVQGVAFNYAEVNANGDEVLFASFKAPTYRVHSAFVRISNMPIQSYNGAKQSVSKMVYHLPRFTNDGREFGDLFFSPGEKTYVALHNATPEILNNIELQIVDVNERPVDDISGSTIIVFHLREKK